jgi:hypothetical protein
MPMSCPSLVEAFGIMPTARFNLKECFGIMPMSCPSLVEAFGIMPMARFNLKEGFGMILQF